jgi:two-component system, NarL family, invasion response regulator UvrY
MPSIMIVEDNDLVRESLRVWLAINFPQCNLMEACSGEDALLQAGVQAPDLVLMDIGLPDMNGIEATRQLHASKPALRIIMLSIQEDAQYVADALAAGASCYVPKRKMHSELVPLLSRLLEMAA